MVFKGTAEGHLHYLNSLKTGSLNISKKNVQQIKKKIDIWQDLSYIIIIHFNMHLRLSLHSSSTGYEIVLLWIAHSSKQECWNLSDLRIRKQTAISICIEYAQSLPLNSEIMWNLPCIYS